MQTQYLIRFIGLISVLATSTLSGPALGQNCLLNRFPKFGKSLTFENIKVIEAKFPSKQKFDALAKNGKWGREELGMYVGCSKAQMDSLFEKRSLKCPKLFNHIENGEITWEGTKKILPNEDQFKKFANKKGEWGVVEIQKFLGC